MVVIPSIIDRADNKKQWRGQGQDNKHHAYRAVYELIILCVLLVYSIPKQGDMTICDIGWLAGWYETVVVGVSGDYSWPTFFFPNQH